jgi:hypothetical protein
LPEAECRAAAAISAGVVIATSDGVEVRIPTLMLEEDIAMTNAIGPLSELAEKGVGVDVLRPMVQFESA